MKGLVVLACTLAVAASSPTLGLLTGHGLGGHHGGGAVLPGGGGCHGSGGLGGGPGGVIGAAVALENAKLNIIANTAGAVLHGGVPFGGVGGRADRGYKGRGGVYPVYGGGLGQGWGFFVRGITDVAGNAGSLLNDLLHSNIPGALDDVLNGGIAVGRALGGIINAFIPGLGTLLGNLVVAIGKIFICVFGSPGISGAVLGNRRPGRNNPVDIPYICNGDWGKKYGWNYDGDYKADLIIKHYQLTNAKGQVLELISRYTNGRGLDGLTFEQRNVCQRILIIAGLLDTDSSNWSQKDIDTLNVNVVIIFGILGNSYQSGLGPILVREWISNWKNSKGNKRGSTDLSRYWDEIFNGIKDAKEDKWSGSFDLNKRGDWDQIQRDTENESSSSNQSNNTNQQQNSQSENSSSSNNNNDSNTSNSSDENNSQSSDRNSASSSNNSNSSDDSNESQSSKKDKSSNNKQIRASDKSKDSESNKNNSQSDDSNDSSGNNNGNSGSDKSNDSESNKNSASESQSSGKNGNNKDRSSDKNNSQSDDSNDSSANNNGRSGSDKSNDSESNKNSAKESQSSGKNGNNKDRSSDKNNSQSDDSNDSSANNNGRSGSNSSDNSNASNNSNNQNGSTNDSEEDSGDGGYKSEDKRLRTATASAEKNVSSSSSGSGKKMVNKDGSSVEEYNYQNANAESIKRSSKNTDAQQHTVEVTPADDF